MQTFKEAYYMGKYRSAAWHADGGANDEGWGRDNSQRHERRAPDHPHSVHINGKKWKTFGSHSHASNVARKIKGATVHREEVELDENWLVHKDGKILKSGIKQYKTAKAHAEKHGAQVNSAEWYHDKISSKNKSVKEDMEQIDELSDTTLMNYAQKVHDDSLKHDKDPSKRSAEKRNKSIMGFSRAINKLESRPVKESTDMCNVCGQTPCNCTHISEETKWKVSYDVHGSNKDVPLYSSHKHVRAKSAEEAINTIKKLVGGTKHKAELVKEENKHYEEAEEHLSKANDAEREGDMASFHHHMSNHHDAMSQWHESKGRSALADKHADKAEYHHEKSLTVEEELSDPVRNAKQNKDIATGKKPMPKSKLPSFKETVELDELSTELLQRYKDKAKQSADELSARGKHKKAADRWLSHMKATGKQIDKTTANIKKALSK